MTNRELDEFRDALRIFDEEHANTRAKARHILHQEGVVTRDGKLKKEFAPRTKKTALAS